MRGLLAGILWYLWGCLGLFINRLCGPKRLSSAYFLNVRQQQRSTPEEEPTFDFWRQTFDNLTSFLSWPIQQLDNRASCCKVPDMQQRSRHTREIGKYMLYIMNRGADKHKHFMPFQCLACKSETTTQPNHIDFGNNDSIFLFIIVPDLCWTFSMFQSFWPQLLSWQIFVWVLKVSIYKSTAFQYWKSNN